MSDTTHLLNSPTTSFSKISPHLIWHSISSGRPLHVLIQTTLAKHLGLATHLASWTLHFWNKHPTIAPGSVAKAGVGEKDDKASVIPNMDEAKNFCIFRWWKIGLSSFPLLKRHLSSSSSSFVFFMWERNRRDEASVLLVLPSISFHRVANGGANARTIPGQQNIKMMQNNRNAFHVSFFIWFFIWDIEQR